MKRLIWTQRWRDEDEKERKKWTEIDRETEKRHADIKSKRWRERKK